MVKHSRTSSASAPRLSTSASAALRQDTLPAAPIAAARFRGLGRAPLILAVGLGAAFAAPREAKALPIFSDNTAFSFPSPQPCADTGDNGCYTNFLSLVDIDQDGDFDILEANGGGLFQPGTAEESVIYGNDGKGAFVDLTAAASATSFGNPHIQGRQVAAGDIDGDGDIDIYQPGAYGTELDKLWLQTSNGVFEDHAATQLPTALMSHASAVKFGDIDGDGDLDLLIADWGTGLATDTGRLILYTNDGTGVFTLLETEHDSAAASASDELPPTIPPASTTGIYGLRPTDIDFADVDGDYDLDILVNNRQGYSRILLNDGKGKFTDATGFVPTFAADGVTVASATSNYPPKVGPYANNQELCDLDEDGDLDIVLDSAGPKPAAVTSGNVSQILINNGSGVFTDDTSNRVLSEPGTEDNVVRCADINADGHYDLVVGGRTNTSEKLLLNDGTGKFSYSDVLAKLPSADTTLAIGVGDLNGDGKIDLVTGQGEGTIVAGNATTLRLNHVYLNNASTTDTTPPVFRKLQTPAPAVGVDTVFYMAVRDSATNDAGQMVKSVAVNYVAKTVAKTSTKTATAAWVGGDLFRVVVPAQVDGTQLTLTPTVTDRVGLVTSAPAMVFQLGTPLPVATGGAGGGPSTTPVEAGAGGSAGSEIGEAGSGGVAGTVSEAGSSGDKSGAGGKSGGGSGGTVAAGDEGGEGGEAPTGSAGKPAASGSSDDGGCSFSPAPSTNSHGAVLLGFGLAMFGLARRRRTQK